jgi:hyperosmotically inducible periplasmic protein
MKRLLAFTVVFGSLFGVVLRAQDQKPATQDDRISDQVRMKLATVADVKGGALDVTVQDGTVVIKGRVDTEKGKSKATKLAKKVKGVKSVDNELVVGPPK